MGDDNAIKFYTGFESFKHFQCIFRCLGQATNHLEYQSRKLTPIDEFFLFMIKIRRNMEDEELSYQFNISKQVVSKVFRTWLNFTFYQLQEDVMFLSREVIDQHMPKDFKAKFPKTRIKNKCWKRQCGDLLHSSW